MDQEQQSRRRPTRRQILWTVGIVVALVVAIIIVLGYVREWAWTGLVKDKAYTKRTLWDWLQLLIIPAVLAGVGLWFNRQQREQELQTADRRAQDEALQAYLDQMSAMLTPTKDQPSLSDEHPPDSLKTVARARTLTVLPRLAGDGKGRVVQFLREANLIPRVVRDEQGEIVQEKVVDLSGANLRDAHLFGLNLRGVALDGVSLERADLRRAHLPDADFGGTRLSGADLTGANLSGASLLNAQLLSERGLKAANLSLAVLSFANLRLADLSGTNLLGTDLSGAKLFAAKLSGAHLYRANLTGATGWTEVQLDQAKSLNGATMPDGRVLKGDKSPHGPTFNEWRQSLREDRGEDVEIREDRGEDVENSSP